MQNLPLELISNVISIIILVMIFRQYLGYKKIIEVIKALKSLKDNKKLSTEDHEYINKNFIEYTNKLKYRTSLNKLLYPVFIIIAAGLTLLFEFSQALIHFNVLVVAFIYITIIKMHINNIVKFLEELKNN